LPLHWEFFTHNGSQVHEPGWFPVTPGRNEALDGQPPPEFCMLMSNSQLCPSFEPHAEVTSLSGCLADPAEPTAAKAATNAPKLKRTESRRIVIVLLLFFDLVCLYV
jgi:hypothetical protein